MWTQGYRDDVWAQLNQPWDVVVVGGGITGAGILAEAARCGKRALLIEARDFSSGTSSRSTKLVHGGIRYLRQGQVFLTRKSLRERETLKREAAGLVDALGFSLASFQGDPMPRWMYGLGLAVYDLLAGNWAHQGLSKTELLQRLPALEGSTAVGGYHYFDAQTDDCRLVLRVLRDGVRRGGVAINYVAAEKLLLGQNGRVAGIAVRDTAPGSSRTAEVRAKAVINATGAWADDLRRGLAGANLNKRIRRIRGSHLTFASSRLPLQEAVSLTHPRDQRVLFAVPWEGTTIFGTTDEDHGDLQQEPSISAKETEYMLEAVRHVFPTLDLSAADIISTWSGVRPVINTGKADPSKESREHALWKENGLVTITGGKLTTFAVMARDALKAVREHIGPLQPRSCIVDPPASAPRFGAHTELAVQARLTGRFGMEVQEVLDAQPGLATIPGTALYWNELTHAARCEGVVSLSDLLLRRVRLGLVLPEGGKALLPQVRAVAQPLLGWTDDQWQTQELDYLQTCAQAYGVPR